MLLAYLHGIASMGCVTIVLFFVRYYQLTKDELFLWFALAFGAFAANWGMLATGFYSEAGYWIYGLRVVGFVLLAVGILRKNRT